MVEDEWNGRFPPERLEADGASLSVTLEDEALEGSISVVGTVSSGFQLSLRSLPRREVLTLDRAEARLAASLSGAANLAEASSSDARPRELEPMEPAIPPDLVLAAAELGCYLMRG